ncbi:alanine dehydrogenase [Curtobacterium sp. MMLR14_010]|uniref:DedA family protein n=1 Tax=Curtobacterium sp. MMLR14_010 TaxID=1898743 RepID=UPI0008DCB46D|nr:DedA family protein [Curtobacterium sp. MMLR14_010]OII29610.1 alanine dehydrogenase [Curtobacterium sp. MMLR14_010]
MTTAVLTTATRAASSSPDADMGGLSGMVLRLIEALGEWGVALMLFVETVFPPIPSEVILPLAGFLAGAGRMNLVLVLVLATLGSYVGALVLYWLGRVIGFERTVRWLGKLPLVDEDDFRKAAAWFHRHGRSAVLFGRLVPIVRSLISLPAGADRMNLASFSLFTILGSGLWNSVLVLGGAALGTQYDKVEGYTEWIDRAMYAAIVVVAVVFIVRRVRRGRAERATRSQGQGQGQGQARSQAPDAGVHGRRRAETTGD